MFDEWFQDVRYATRLLRRNPLFALTAVLSLSIGIGANTTIFTIANALLFRTPAGVAEPERLVDIGRAQNGSGFDNSSYPNYLDLRSRNTVFAGVFAYRPEPQPMSLGGRDGAERIYGSLVTTNYFTILGARPEVGRFFANADGDQPGATPLVVLSHAFWTRRFKADSSIVGQTIDLNTHPFTVVGVAPEGFHGTNILTADVWVPLTMLAEAMPRRSASLLTSRPSVWLLLGARLKPGVSIAQARDETDRISRDLEREFPQDNRGKSFRVAAVSPIPGNGAPVAAFLAAMTVVVALVLATACANLAGVLLARATARRREIAVRLAIGAGRGRLIRQMLVETMLLFVAGAAGAFVVARLMASAVVAMLPTLPVPIDMSLPVDRAVIALTFAVSLAASLLSGLAPALQASRSELVASLKSESPAAPQRLRLRNAFVVGQVAFSMMLVVATALFVRALQRAADVDPGFDSRGVELASLDLSLGGYGGDAGRAFARQLVERVREMPGAQSAALAAMVPLGGAGLGLGGLAVPGWTPPSGSRFADSDWNVVTPGYFSMMRMRLTAGRDFTDADDARAASVVIVNETAARRWWGTIDVVGKTLEQQDGTAAQPDRVRALTVVGVAADSKYRSLDEAPRTFVYVPLAQQFVPRVTIVARSTNGQRLAADLRRLIASMNPNLPIVESQTLEDFASLGLLPQRIAASVAGSLGIVGLLLASIGIYGVTAYMVSTRTREIGIRMALGAQRADVVRMVLRQGAWTALVGAAIGLVLAAAASRLLGTLLFGVGPADPVAFGGSAALFSVVALCACYVPARRATEIEAAEALRQD